MESNKIGHAIR